MAVLDDGRRLIEASGPRRCDVLLVGEAGGETEHRMGRPFVGKAGTVLTAYCLAAGLARPDLRITNLYPFWPGPGNPDPTPEQILGDEWRLVEEIKRCRPKVIGAVGRLAARWFLGDVDMETVHGVPLPSDRAPGAVVVPIYHPAAGFYEPTRAAFSQEDIMRLAYYAKSPAPPRDPPEFQVIEQAYIDAAGYGAACDTEWGEKSGPWGLSWSTDGKTAVVVRVKAGSKPRLQGKIEFHNALADLPTLRAMGMDTSLIDPGDTMVRLYNLQLEPQSLKAAAYRWLGLRMEEFDGTVREHFDAVAIEWLKKAAAFEDYPKPKERPVEDFAKKKWRLYKPWDAGRRIRSIIGAYEKADAARWLAPPSDKDPDALKLEKKWAKLPDEFRGQAEYRMSEAGEPEFPEFSLTCVPLKKAVRYSGTDAIATKLLVPILDRLIDEKGLRGVYEMDRRALKFVDRMQEVGMRVELEGEHGIKALEVDLENRRDVAAKKVRRVVGDRWFNPGSGDQVAAWLYRVRGLEPMKLTDKGRGSTSDDSLQMLRGYNGDDAEIVEFITGVQDYREADKYLGTFIQPIFGYMRQDKQGNWRIHPNFRVTRVVSGRNSSHDPNVLAIPSRTDLGQRIRAVFVAGDGYVLIDADLSQIELRGGAHLSRDRRMCDAFANDEDLHAVTTMAIFKMKTIDEAKADKSKRYVAKVVNFAVFYGISAQALLEQLYKAGIFDFTLADCERFIADWFKLYAGVRGFQERLWRQAAKDGFVRDMWGRICYVPNLRVMDRKMQEAAQRLAGNFPVQSMVSGFIKRAEARLLDFVDEQGLRDQVRPWLQMHDELLVEVKDEAGLVEDMKQTIEWAMLADRAKLSVPMKAEAGVGRSWKEAK